MPIPQDLKKYFPDMESLTPAMRQFVTVKADYPDAILFFQMGDFYEMFGEDAVRASKVLGIALTSRDKKKIPLSGIPLHAKNAHLSKLISQGFKVVICDQIGNPKQAKGIVDRKVVRVITPGTILENDILQSGSNNFLVAVSDGLVQTQHSKKSRRERGFGLCKADVSTGEIEVYEFPGRSSLPDLVSELIKINPGEIILTETVARQLSHHPLAGKFTILTEQMSEKEQKSTLKKQFGTPNLTKFGFKDYLVAENSCAQLLKYVENTQFQKAGHFQTVNLFSQQRHMNLDPATIQNLDLLENSHSRTEQGSLFHSMNFCLTAMGARELKQRILYPLKEKNALEERLNQLSFLMKDSLLRNRMKEALRNISDLERLCSRLSLGHIMPRELLHLGHSLEYSIKLLKITEKMTAKTKAEPDNGSEKELTIMQCELDDIAQIVDEINCCIIPEPAQTLKSGGIIQPTFSAELRELITLSEQGDQWLIEFESRERTRTGIPKLRVKQNSVFGYFIEISNTYRDKTPDNYTRKQTLTNCERYITSELKEFEVKALHAREKSNELQFHIFQELRESICKRLFTIQCCARTVAHLDILYSLSALAMTHRYVRPVFCSEKKISIRNGRHPVVEQELNGNRFVPNDTLLQDENEILGIITGPNMAGKSTYLRQVALITLMAHMGSYVPADSVILSVHDRIFTRIGASDNLAEGESTFMVEMNETAYILNHATDRSLVILDELGRGTSTYDGLAIAWAIIENLLEKIHALTLFATHYHELIALPQTHSGAFNLCTLIKEEDNDKILFLHQVVRGSSDRSYGIHVAQLAGIPDPVVQRSQEILFQLEQQNPSEVQKKRRVIQPSQLALFAAEKHPLLAELEHLSLDQLTPLDALNLLHTYKSRLKRD